MPKFGKHPITKGSDLYLLMCGIPVGGDIVTTRHGAMALRGLWDGGGTPSSP
jgi:hypothetical protein